MKHNIRDWPGAERVAWDKAKGRINAPIRKIPRFATGSESLDTFLGGGLPFGLSLFGGPPGSGKSAMARHIATMVADSGRRVGYMYFESSMDPPDFHLHPTVFTYDGLSWKENPLGTLNTIYRFIVECELDLLFLDSVTIASAATNRAVPEAEIRDFASKLQVRVNGRLPVVGISEIRGPDHIYAGGIGVQHACNLSLDFEKILAEKPWEAERYSVDQGGFVWLVSCSKDKEGKAAQGRKWQVTYVGTDPMLEPV